MNANDTSDEKCWKNWVLVFILVCVCAKAATIHMHHAFYHYDANFPYYLLSYRLAFTPRAVIGTIFDFLHNSCGIGWKTFCILRFAFTTLAYCLAATWIYTLLLNIKNRILALMLGLFIFALPATFHPLAIINVFDVYLVLIMLLCAWLTLRESPFRIIAPLLMALAVLTHENFIFMYMPFLLGLIIWKSKYKSLKDHIWLIYTFLLPAVTFGTMAWHRGVLHRKPEQLASLNEALVQKGMEYGLQQENCLLTLNPTYIEHIKSVWHHFITEQFGPYQLCINAISFIILIPAALLLFTLWRNAWKQIPNEQHTKLLCLMLSCFGGCGLFIVAHDYIRWTSAIFICNTLALLIIYADRQLGVNFKISKSNLMKWAALCLFYLCLDPPTGICFSIADLIAYPVYKLCM